jgi:putative ABC transport system permease protein
MNLAEIARFALRGLLANKMRSGLTMLGIMIGTAAVIVLVAVGNGASQQVEQNIQSLGSNSLTIFPSTSGARARGPGVVFGPGGSAAGQQQEGRQDGPRTQAKDLSVADAQALSDRASAPSVKSASPVVTAPSQAATYLGSSHSIGQFVGTYPPYFTTTNKVVAGGTYFTADDVANARKVVVIGQTVAGGLFGSVDPVGKQITVGGVNFTVVGVLRESGSGGFQDADDIAIAPLPAVQQSLTGFGALSQIVVQATGPNTVNAAESEVTALLNQRHGVTGAAASDFTILNQASLQSALSDVTQTLTVLLGAIAAISLLVGGIGITNIMLVTVTERTREIGIRKAIGAPKSAIIGQFLVEATVLSLAGGIFGVLIGLTSGQVSVGDFRPVVTPSSVALALGVSLVIGLFFGSYPANRAARLRPIDALRHE